MPEYTLAQAIAVTGRSRSTLIRAIRSGKLSAIRDEAGAYLVEPSELNRVFNGGSSPDVPDGVPRHAELAARLEAEQAKVAMLQETVGDLRRRLDAEAEERRRLTAILADQRAAPAPYRRWWRFGR